MTLGLHVKGVHAWVQKWAQGTLFGVQAMLPWNSLPLV